MRDANTIERAVTRRSIVRACVIHRTLARDFQFLFPLNKHGQERCHWFVLTLAGDSGTDHCLAHLESAARHRDAVRSLARHLGREGFGGDCADLANPHRKPSISTVMRLVA